MKEIGVYIHIPFCKQKCYYCDFVSFVNKECFYKKYIDALIKEITSFLDNNTVKISTIYIGGGTPSIIDEKYIEQVINIFKKRNLLGDTKEITIEVNPGTVTIDKLKTYKNIGINRLSIGLQSTKDELLKKIGRIHNYKEFETTYNLARNVGFNNINVDLMIGLPGQKIEDIKETVNKITTLNPEHISVYSLIIEENTPIMNLLESGAINLPDEELERNMYWYVKNVLELNGYKHYEISNFAKPNYTSKHNLDCWSQKEYIGFGVAAYSYMDKKRFGNISDLEKYILNCENNEFGKNIVIDEIQNCNYKLEQEFMMLGLRKIEGVSISDFKNKFGENPIFVFRKELEKLVNEELIIIDGDYIRLTNRGLDLANLVWEEFV